MTTPHGHGIDPDRHTIGYLFIRRPVLAMVISIVITLLGLFAMSTLPINRYPQITPPAVQINATYPGATAEQVSTAVAAPIEQQLSGLDGLLYYKTAAASDGSLNIQLFFDISRPQDLAAVDVQNQVAVALPQLPQEVQRNGITVLKSQTDILLAITLLSDDPRYDAAALSNYSKVYLQDELARIQGVGQATTFGQLDFSMLLSLDPGRMAALGVTIPDVISAVQAQNTTNPAGRIGREPAPQGTEYTLPVTTLGRLTMPEQFAGIIVRGRPGQPGAAVLRVRDIGQVRLGSKSYDQLARLSGRPAASLLVFLRPNANALQVKKAVLARIRELERSFPAGVHWVLGYDTTPFITASVNEVIITLGIAMLLVTGVVFMFLQNWRSTLIPLLAVPVSIIGTFFGMSLMGFSINLLTLFGLVLAIGIVVDDAIVVIENVERIMEDEHLPAAIAADRAIRQVAPALVAIVLVLCSVFVPVAFLGGITGQLYKQFAVTIVISVVLSGIVALTLTPALCSLMLQPGRTAPQRGVFAWFNRGFERTRTGYIDTVRHLISHPVILVGVFVVMICCIYGLFRTRPTAFLPTEDKGYFGVAIELPGSASLQRTNEVVQSINDYLLKQPAVDHTFALEGFSFIQGAAQTSSASMFVILKDWDERKAPGDQFDAVLGAANGRLAQIPQAIAFAFNLPEIPGLGATAGLEMNLQARSVSDVNRFAALAQQFVADANRLPETQRLATTIRVDAPQVYVDVDRDKVTSFGVPLGDVFSTLQAMLSTYYVNDFNLYGKTYRVQLEAQSPYRQHPDDIGRLYVRGLSGTMIPISALTTTRFSAGPTLLNRFNGFPSALVTGFPAPGKSSGQLLAAVKRLADEKYAPLGLGYAFSGQTYQETMSGGEGALVFTLGIIMAFLVLAAQYESWSTPFAVMLGVPFGVLGALLGLWIRSMPNDVYFQIGLIVVIGLGAKNAILIVEFASELRAAGRSVKDAAVEAGRERLRPILMTSFAFILGVVPLLTAAGAGAASRHSIGTGVFFGMLGATTLGVFFIPSLFVAIRTLSERTMARGRLPRSPGAAASGITPAPSGAD